MYPKLQFVLKRIVSELSLPLTFNICDQKIFFKDEKRVKGFVSLYDFEVFYNENYYGKLCENIAYFSVHPCEFKSISFVKRNTTQLLGADSKSLLDILYDGGKFFILNLEPNSASVIKVSTILSEVQTSVYKTCSEMFGVENFRFRDKFSEKSVKRPTDYQLISILLRECPEIEIYYLRDKEHEGSFYECNKVSNKWSRRNNSYIEDQIAKYFTETISLMSLTYKVAQTHNSQVALRKLLYKRMARNKIDSVEVFKGDPKLFAMNNLVLDLNKHPGPELRKIAINDYILETTEWDYSDDDALRYRDDLKKFLEASFPEPQELKIFLRWVSLTLSGVRRDKNFLVLTDQIGGNNGKSSVFNLLKSFFGFYKNTNSEFVNKPSNTQSRDSHNAGLNIMRSKGILLLDELHDETVLSMKYIKEITGGFFTAVGRIFNSSQGFEYTWEAGMIMAFNGVTAPFFDGNDPSIVDRLIAIPMRTKFSNVGEETKKIDRDMKEKFPLWRSSLLKLLIENYDLNYEISEDVFTPDMKKLKKEILEGSLKYTIWLKEIDKKGKFEKTEDESNFLSLNDLYETYKGVRRLKNNNQQYGFRKTARLWFEEKGYSIEDKYHYHLTDNEGKKTKIYKRSTIFGIKKFDFL